MPDEIPASVEKFQLSRIRPRHSEIARRLIIGQTNKQISEQLGMTGARLWMITNSPLFKAELARLERERDAVAVDMSKQLGDLAPMALEEITRTLFMSPSQSLRLDAAKDLMDRAGYGRHARLDVNVRGQIDYSAYTNDELKKLVQERLQRLQGAEEAEQETIHQANNYQLEWDVVETTPEREYDGEIAADPQPDFDPVAAALAEFNSE